MAAREPFNVTVRSPAVTTQRSPWHSPVPYLFGGLAAMLGLIAFALLILACSYWKLSGYLLSNENDGERDLEAEEGGGKGDKAQKAPQDFEEKILVIMAGDMKPTFLATPISSRLSSFGDSSSNTSTICSCNKSDKPVEMAEANTVKSQQPSSRESENVHHHEHGHGHEHENSSSSNNNNNNNTSDTAREGVSTDQSH